MRAIRWFFLISGCFMVISVRLFAQDLRPHIYSLDATFTPEQSRIKARAEIRFKNVEVHPKEISFFLHSELGVDSLFVGGEPVPFSWDKVFYPYNYSLIATKITIDLKDRTACGDYFWQTYK